MIGKYTQLYHKKYDEVLEACKNELKERIRAKKYETIEEVVSQYSNQINDRVNHLYKSRTQDNHPRISWFKEKLFRKFASDKIRFEQNFFVDGFIENTLPKISTEFKERYNSSSDLDKTVYFFDKEYVQSATNEQIVNLMATYYAYDQIIKMRHQIKKDLIEVLEAEKELVNFNNFNGLEPSEIYMYFKQLTQINPANGDPFLTEKQVYDLTNMICEDKPTHHPVQINIDNKQGRLIIRFIYTFYRYSLDANANKNWKNAKDYMSILTKYISPFTEGKPKVDESNFARVAKRPLKIDSKYFRWQNS